MRLPNSRSITAPLRPKPPGYITKSTRWKKRRASWVYGTPFDATLPGNIPTPQAFDNEPHAIEEDRAAVISSDADYVKQNGDEAAVGAQFGLGGESGEGCDVPDM